MANGYRSEFLNRLNSGGELSEREILNIILSNAYGGKDFSKVADALLTRFPSVRALLDANLSEIIAVGGVTEAVACYIKSVKLAEEYLKNGEIYLDCEGFPAFARARLGGRANEFMEAYLVNRSGKVVAVKSYTSGKPDRVEITSGEILAAISASGAYGLYFAHNHVNFGASPSADDDRVTAKLKEACGMCKIIFFDHCVVGWKGETFSYLKSGRMEKIEIE
ncbi:MAG: hypothetical protein NC131_04000 [Roseburia sp.]|nr:hypothetical protein [Roseburia sp.]